MRQAQRNYGPGTDRNSKMCVIISHHPNTAINYTELDRACATNPHGNGYIIASKGYFESGKGKSLEFIIERFKEAPQDSYRAIHARIATSGGQGTNMCHPFTSKDGRYLLMHNGVVSSDGLEGDAHQSDTSKLANYISDYLEYGRKELEELAHVNSSRFLILDLEGMTVEHFGKWKFTNGVWRSNLDHLNTWSTAA